MNPQPAAPALPLELNVYANAALRFANVRDLYFNLRHAACGMATEAGELVDAWKRQAIYGKPPNPINVREEVGDGLWYANLLAYTLGVPFKRWQLLCIGSCDCGRVGPAIGQLPEAACTKAVEPRDFFDTSHSLFALAAQVTEQVRAITTYGNRDALSETLPLALSAYISVLDEIARTFGTSLEECAAVNISKLTVRYPNGFSPESALNRNLAAEGIALAGTAH